MLTHVALVGIAFYQRVLSPRKGYRCAYSVAHGGTGCSGYAKHAIRDRGLLAAVPAIRQRFRDCRMAYETLHSEPPRDDTDRRRARWCRRVERSCDGACCIGEAGTLLPRSCLGAAPRGASSKTCDLNPCDGDVGCGGCDVCSCG